MQTVEFRTRVENGMIRLPKKYRDKLKNIVKVIILDDSGSSTEEDIIERLLAKPMKIARFKPIKREAIYAR